MSREEFEKLIGEEFPSAVPEKFHHLIKNVVFLAEDKPDEATRKEEGLGEGETLLGLYRGIPHTARGNHYGEGMTLPDTITLYRLPLEEEAAMLAAKYSLSGEVAMRRAIRETIWHEVAHYMGYDEYQVRGREDERDIV
ncbi:MAG: uncharacterized protein JWL87_460 [Candidatus Adlerbacteria bacterium]|nr:uncharacterized protein [Candidatus Adlerbacteria bacterium]